MKTILVSIFFAMAATGIAQQSTIKTETFVVSGNCGECKERIENAADIKGVKKTTWDEKTHVATVIFDSTKTSVQQVKQAIAAHGHDAGEIKASDKAYNGLPKCCRYRTGKCEEPPAKK